MPNMIGVSFKDALFMLENYGLIVSVQGTGMINYQSIQKGEKIRVMNLSSEKNLVAWVLNEKKVTTQTNINRN